jgi:hypothetical protein
MAIAIVNVIMQGGRFVFGTPKGTPEPFRQTRRLNSSGVIFRGRIRRAEREIRKHQK